MVIVFAKGNRAKKSMEIENRPSKRKHLKSYFILNPSRLGLGNSIIINSQNGKNAQKNTNNIFKGHFFIKHNLIGPSGSITKVCSFATLWIS